MKYVMRRLLLAPIVTPLVALAYTALYAYLILIGGEPQSSVSEVFSNGLVMGVIGSIVLAFYPLLKKFF